MADGRPICCQEGCRKFSAFSCTQKKCGYHCKDEKCRRHFGDRMENHKNVRCSHADCKKPSSRICPYGKCRKHCENVNYEYECKVHWEPWRVKRKVYSEEDHPNNAHGKVCCEDECYNLMALKCSVKKCEEHCNYFACEKHNIK